MSVYHKLMDARVKLQARKLNKSGVNKFAGYEYFELGDFLPAIQEIFSEVGLCGIVSYQPDIASLAIHDVEGGDPIIITSPMGSAALKGCHEVQNIGAVETYQRRYLWVTAMEIVEHDALDAMTGKEKPVKPPSGSAAEIKHDAYESLDADGKAFIDNLAVEVVDILGTDGAPEAIKYINVKLQNTDLEWRNALWHRLDSKTRTALKAKSQVEGELNP